MKKNIIIYIALIVAIIVGLLYIGHLRSQVRYVDTSCPICGSSEVLDFGTGDDGNQRAHCFDCSTEFLTLNQR